MREELQRLNGKRITAWGTVSRFGSKPSYRGPPKATLLLRDVAWHRGALTDHLWFTVGARIAALKLKEGDVVEFDARVSKYVKGYRGHRDDSDSPEVEVDYRLSNPTRLRHRTTQPQDAPQQTRLDS